MRITGIETHVLLDPDFDRTATSSAQDSIVVEIITDEGIVGIGETDVNAWVARACIEAPGTHTMDRGLKQMLIGRDPLKPRDIWHDLYIGTAMTGRRGAAVHALGALDMAVWDICGKANGVPCWQLWGDPVRNELTPYASLQPETEDYDQYLESMVRWAEAAKATGFRACKLEATFSGPYVHKGLNGPDERVVEVVRAVREAVGFDLDLMVDVQYAFSTVDQALDVIQALAAFDVFFLEAPLWADDIEGYAALCSRTPIRIAAGEWLSSVHEFDSLIRHGGVHVVQPDIGRVGGFTEALRVCERASLHGRMVVPHAWKTGISAAAAAHLAMVSDDLPYFEFLPPDFCHSRLRKELTYDELKFEGGRVAPPTLPGLGIQINRDALAEFEETASREYELQVRG
jgi:L-alanine-DL-glutamate epimerase-like enolase superfamily enzyme